MERFVDAKAIAAFAFMLKSNWSSCTAVSRRHVIVRYGSSSLCGSSRVDFGTRSSAGSVFSPLLGAVCDIDNPRIQSYMTESLLSTTTDSSLSVGVAIKSLSRGLAIFRHSVQGA
jgi:hypothetical protein